MAFYSNYSRDRHTIPQEVVDAVTTLKVFLLESGETKWTYREMQGLADKEWFERSMPVQVTVELVR